MEHSLLHALQLCGLIGTLGGCFYYFFLLSPVIGSSNLHWSPELLTRVRSNPAYVCGLAALIAATAGALDYLVQLAELQGKPIYGPVNLELAVEFAASTTAGRLLLGRIFLLALAGVLLLRNCWVFATVAALAAAICTGFVNHAAALPENRWPAVVAHFLHLLAATIWLGSLYHIWRAVRRSSVAPEEQRLIAALVARFSPLALTVVMLLGITGLYTLSRFLTSPQSLMDSPYGLAMVLKLGLLGFALHAGFVNWKRLGPQLSTRPEALPQFVNRVELELSAGVLVVILAGILGSVSPPGPEGSLRLNPAQMQALLQPKLPPTQLVDPKTFVGAPMRTEEDLRYSEFTHRWAGLFVAVLGACWFGQSLPGRWSGICSKSWPFLLIGFGIFISYIADPEVWQMGSFSIRDLFQNPDMLQHQLGAVMVFVLAGFGFRDLNRTGKLRPLGFALPAVMILGSLMLLGHTHTSLRMSEPLSTLITYQHMIIGGLGLFGGFFRWTQLRELLPLKPTRVAWPFCVVLLGLLMAFGYTEQF